MERSPDCVQYPAPDMDMNCWTLSRCPLANLCYYKYPHVGS